MVPCRLIDLDAIDASLSDVQAHFAELNASLNEPRDPMVDQVRQNMLEGYALVDRLVADRVDILGLQDIGQMLELNKAVLCGSDPGRIREYAPHIAATESRFFEDAEGGIGDLLEWYGRHRGESVWKRAAGCFVRILSKPQLFIEGNTRTGSLIASYVLMREGYSPFVLTRDNAVAYFNPAAVIRRLPKHGMPALFELPKIKKKYAAFLQEQSQQKFLAGDRQRA